MSLAGWSTQQLDGIDGVLNLAAASGMELAFAQANSNTTAQQWEMHTETALLSFIQADRI